MRLPEPETTGPRRQRSPTVRSLLPAALAGGSEAELLDLAQLKTERACAAHSPVPALPPCAGRLSPVLSPVPFPAHEAVSPVQILTLPSHPQEPSWRPAESSKKRGGATSNPQPLRTGAPLRAPQNCCLPIFKASSLSEQLPCPPYRLNTPPQGHLPALPRLVTVHGKPPSGHPPVTQCPSRESPERPMTHWFQNLPQSLQWSRVGCSAMAVRCLEPARPTLWCQERASA